VIHQEPETAALWADTVAEVYIDQSIATRIDNATRAYEWIQKQLANTQRSMRDAQEKLLKGMEGQDLFVPDGSVSAVSSSISKLNEDFIEARKRGIVLASALKQIEEMRRTKENLETLPQVAADPLFGTLNSQLANFNLDLSRLKEKFKDAHPEVQKIQAQIDQTRRARDTRVTQIAEALRAEYAQVQRQEGELRAAIDGQKAQAASQSLKARSRRSEGADSARTLRSAAPEAQRDQHRVVDPHQT
jgi:GumC protein